MCGWFFFPLWYFERFLHSGGWSGLQWQKEAWVSPWSWQLTLAEDVREPSFSPPSTPQPSEARWTAVCSFHSSLPHVVWTSSSSFFEHLLGGRPSEGSLKAASLSSPRTSTRQWCYLSPKKVLDVSLLPISADARIAWKESQRKKERKKNYTEIVLGGGVVQHAPGIDTTSQGQHVIWSNRWLFCFQLEPSWPSLN